MEYEITISISSSDPEAPIEEFITALETLLTWQWDNVMLRSREVHKEIE
jgi:hypothetical protein